MIINTNVQKPLTEEEKLRRPLKMLETHSKEML